MKNIRDRATAIQAKQEEVVVKSTNVSDLEVGIKVVTTTTASYSSNLLWITKFDEKSGRNFYYNRKTKASVWKKPENMNEEYIIESNSNNNNIKLIENKDIKGIGITPINNDPILKRPVTPPKHARSEKPTNMEIINNEIKPYDKIVDKVDVKTSIISSSSSDDPWIEVQDKKTGKRFFYNKETKKVYIYIYQFNVHMYMYIYIYTEFLVQTNFWKK